MDEASTAPPSCVFPASIAGQLDDDSRALRIEDYQQ